MKDRKLFLFTLGYLLTSCANPTSAVQSDVVSFSKKYPNNFGYVESNQRKVHFAWAGNPEKRPLVFVHGSPGSWKGWAHFLLNEELQRRFYLVAIDRLGYGDSGNGLAEGSLDKQAHAVLAVLQKSRSSAGAILVGHSFGGPVIASAAMLDPKKISGLIFVASSVSPALEKVKWFQYPASWWPISRLIPTELRVCNEEIFMLKNELMKQTNAWEKIESAVAIVQGMTDSLVPPENADFLITHLTKAKIVAVEKTPAQGHFIPWERPDLILRAILKVEATLFGSEAPLN